MKLIACEPGAWSAREGLRGKANLTIRADTMRRTAPTLESYRITDGIVVIRVGGIMLTRPDFVDQFLGGFTDRRDITRQVELASVDNAVKAIVLRVDSPGGSVDGLAELGDAVRAAARRKPTIGQVEGMAASAAYYAIAGASEIVAGRMDMVGSVGTILVVYDASEAAQSAGLRVVPITSGKFKATAAFGTPLTADEQAYLQGIVDSYFADFRRTVMSGGGRFIGPAEWSEVSDGRVFVAGEAKRLGLVDKFGRMGDTVAALARLADDSQRTRARVQRQSLAVGEMDARGRVVDRVGKQRAALQLAELRR